MIEIAARSLAALLLVGLAHAQALSDLPEGWVSDETYLAYSNIRYVAPDAKFRVDINDEDATELTAASWLDAYLDRQAERYTVVERSPAAPAYDMMSALEDDAEAATATLSHRYKDGPVERRIVTAIVREGEPVTLVNVNGMQGMPTPDELQVAADLAVRTVVRTGPDVARSKLAETRPATPVARANPLEAVLRGVLLGEEDCDDALAVAARAETAPDTALAETIARVCEERAKEARGALRDEGTKPSRPLNPKIAAHPEGSPERRAAIRELAREAAREKLAAAGKSEAAPRAQTEDASGGITGSAKPRGNAHVGVQEVVHQTYDTSAGDFPDVAHHVFFLYGDGTALRSPNIPIIDVGIAVSKAEWPEGWYEWRRTGGALEVRKPGEDWVKLRGTTQTLSPSKDGLKLDGYYQFVRTSGSMVFGASILRLGYTFGPDGRYAQSSDSMVGGGVDLGAGPRPLAASYCTKDGGGTAVATGNPNAPGGSERRPGCGKANEGAYEIGGYAITLYADDGKTYRLPFYEIAANTVLIKGRWYYRSQD